MVEKSNILPRSSSPRRVSKSALAIIVGSLFLATLLAVSTVRNLNKEEQLIKDLLFREAMTLVRTFEAGARTTMLNYMQGTNPLATLVQETVKEESILYIRIVDEHDRLIAGAGAWRENEHRPAAMTVLAKEEPVTTQFKEHNVFEVATMFSPLTGPGCQGAAIQNQWRSICSMGDPQKQHQTQPVIFIGLRTDRLDEARHEDIHHALFMYGILFLLGSTGLYFLFLYQRMQVVRTTLSNMQLYTENVIESMPAGLITLDGGGRIVSCNSSTEELAGLSFPEMEGKQITEIFPACPLDRFDSDKAVLDWSIDLVRKDGKTVPVKVSSSQMKDHTGTVIGTVVTLRDMRELRKMEQQLERSRRLAALGQMATGVAHEVRNPLGTLRGFAQYFGSQAKDNSESRQYAELMMSEVDRLNQTVSGLLQFARQREPDCIRVDVCRLLEKTASLMETDFQGHHVELKIACEHGLQVTADPDMLLQVLLNLLKNSLSATPEGGVVRLSARQDNESMYLQVADTGQGMPESVRDRMFDPFFTTKKSGTGLGLAVSHQIVEQHDGHFEIESRVGEGTIITVILPAFKEEESNDRQS